jgi:hypothetical protein
MRERPDDTLDFAPARVNALVLARPSGSDRPLSQRGHPLPGLGEWDGPIYGELGVLNVDEDGRPGCHACGRRFRFLGRHIGRA